MIYTLPEYYPQFHCIAGECDETCCAGWQIVIDRQSLARYVRMKGPYRRRLFFSISFLTSTFHQDRERRCAHLRDDGLCDLYIHCGPDSLCRTCRLYPRHIEEFENVREISLEISCPEVCRMVLEKNEKVRYLSFERDTGREETFENYDALFYSQLDYARGRLIELAQDRSLTVPGRCVMILKIARELQKCCDERNLFSFDEILSEYTEPETEKETLRRAAGFSAGERRWEHRFFRELTRMEPLRSTWPSWLREAETRLWGENPCRRKFERWMREDARNWEIPFEQILVYFLFGDFCGSVYDGKIYTTAQSIVSQVLAIRMMMAAVWQRNGNTIDMEDLEEMTVRCCREIGHSDINRRRLERFLERNPALPDL